MSRTTKEFLTFIDESLNEQQKLAVTHTNGPLLVVAGAGSGKTRVITARIAHLLQVNGVMPSEIIALTFTNKAAHEMKERIISFIGKQNLPFIGTFHSYCLYLLKRHADLLPYDTFSILDEDDKRSMLTALLKKSPLYKKYTPQQFSYQISLFKNQISSIDSDTSEFINNRILIELFHEYEKEKRSSKCLDFDDLLLEVVRLFKQPEFKQKHIDRVRHILIDEYQDTNTVQHHFLKEMCLHNNETKLAIDSLCVVGDEDQSIYSWRGATVDNIMGFTRDFSDTTTIKIEQNYRSKAPILQTANHLIKNNLNRNEKKLWSEKEGRDCVRVLQCASSYQEADIIATFAKLLRNRDALQNSAVLYRTHAQSRTIEEGLIKSSIPYTLVGGIRFYERKEIKDILAYMRLIINPFDRIAFARALTVPTRGLGDKFLEQFTQLWDENLSLNFIQIAHKCIEDGLLGASKKETLMNFCSLFENLSPLSSAVDAVTHILTLVDFRNYVRSSYEQQEALERLENVKEFINALHYFAGENKTTVAQVLDEVSLLQERADKDAQAEPGITLMTLHAAKGLEFDTVIIPGLEEGLFPSTRTTYDLNEIEEERRLLYVGITRACDRLLITHAHYRQLYGKMEETAPSRFIKEINLSFVRQDNASAWPLYESAQYLSSWIGGTASQQPLFKPSIPITQMPQRPQVKVQQDTQKETPFKKYQTIKHPVFGLGVVKDIEEKQNKTFITAQFKDGIKKIDSSFIQSV